MAETFCSIYGQSSKDQRSQSLESLYNRLEKLNPQHTTFLGSTILPEINTTSETSLLLSLFVNRTFFMRAGKFGNGDFEGDGRGVSRLSKIHRLLKPSL